MIFGGWNLGASENCGCGDLIWWLCRLLEVIIDRLVFRMSFQMFDQLEERLARTAMERYEFADSLDSFGAS